MQLTKSIYCIDIHNNSYIIIDKKIAIIDAVDTNNITLWLSKIDKLLLQRQPDYFILTHIDQTSVILSLCQKYPHMKLIMNTHVDLPISNPIYVINDNDTIYLGMHTLLLKNINDMILIYNIEYKILFSSLVFSIEDRHQAWNEDARYYYAMNTHYFNYLVLDFIKSLDYTMICPYIGSVITNDFKQYIRYYELWIQCIPEDDGVMILTDSYNNKVYEACLYLYNELLKHGDSAIVCDIRKNDFSYTFSQALKYDRIVIGAHISIIEPLLYQLQNRVIGGIYDDMNQLSQLKSIIACLNNILYLEPIFLDKHYQSIMNEYVCNLLEVGCSNGICM